MFIWPEHTIYSCPQNSNIWSLAFSCDAAKQWNYLCTNCAFKIPFFRKHKHSPLQISFLLISLYCLYPFIDYFSSFLLPVCLQFCTLSSLLPIFLFFSCPAVLCQARSACPYRSVILYNINCTLLAITSTASRADTDILWSIWCSVKWMKANRCIRMSSS